MTLSKVKWPPTRDKKVTLNQLVQHFSWLQTEAAGSECHHWETRRLVGSASEIQRSRPGQGDDRLQGGSSCRKLAEVWDISSIQGTNDHISPASRHSWVDDFPAFPWWDMWSFPGGYRNVWDLWKDLTEITDIYHIIIHPYFEANACRACLEKRSTLWKWRSWDPYCLCLNL